jgi:hypothetical protein
VKRTFEFSGVTARLSPLAEAGAAAVVLEAVVALEVTARALFAAGSSHAVIKSANDKIANPIVFIILLKDILVPQSSKTSLHFHCTSLCSNRLSRMTHGYIHIKPEVQFRTISGASSMLVNRIDIKTFPGS